MTTRMAFKNYTCIKYQLIDKNTCSFSGILLSMMLLKFTYINPEILL